MNSKKLKNEDIEYNHRINISAYRLLLVYRLLSQHEKITLDDLNKFLLSNPMVQRTFTHETLNKYLYTLSLIGCRISRQDVQNNSVYTLESHPFQLEPSESETALFKIVFDLLSLHPLTSNQSFYQLLKRISKMPHYLADDPFLGLSANAALSYKDYPPVIRFQKYCIEGQVLEICYQPDEQTETVLTLVEPCEVIYHKKRLYLVGNDPRAGKRVRYELDRIVSHRQLPSRVRTQAPKTTVSFKLMDRVSRNYRPYPGEVVWDKEEFLLVKHTTDDVEQLLKRLLKYGHHCQVISPESARVAMQELIDAMLLTLNEPISRDLLDVVQREIHENNLLSRALEEHSV